MHPLREARLHYVTPALAALRASGRLPEAGARAASGAAAARAPLRVLDVGFGRGMNTAALLADAGSTVEVLGLEPYPERLEPWPRRPPRGADFPWWGGLPGRWQQGESTVEVRAAPAPEGLRPEDGPFDLVLLDLYSPRACPADWAPGLCAALAAAAAPGAVLSSYCCARPVRDALEEAGWETRVLRRDQVRDTLLATLREVQQR